MAAIGVGLLAPHSRMAAALALAGPLAAIASAVGLVAARRRTGTAPGMRPEGWMASGWMASGSIASGSIASGSMRPDSLPSLSVLIPARDEAHVIGALIADLGIQDHRDAAGTPCFEVVVIDDGSDDGTAEVAKAALQNACLGRFSWVIRRAPGAVSGKSAALASVPMTELRGEVMLVLDADARIAPGFLRTAAAILASGPVAVTARRRMLTPSGGAWPQLLACLQDDEQTIDGAIQQARWNLGAGSEFRGDGSAIWLDALRDAGGWDPGALTEDLELSGRLLAARGESVAWHPEFVAWEQPVVDLRSLARQRLRWADGLVRRELRVTPSVVTSRLLSHRQRLIVIAYSLQALAPLACAGLLLRVRSGSARRLLLLIGAAYLTSAAALGGTALRGDGASRGGATAASLARTAGVIVFSAHWLVLLPVAWLRAALRSGPPAFARTHHGAGFVLPPR